MSLGRITLISAVLIVLVGCSKEEKNTTSIKKLETSMCFESISDDVLDYFAIEYVYIDFQGNKVTKEITQADTIVFSIDKPDLGETASTPFSAGIQVYQKKSTEKEIGTYDNILNWSLVLKGYDRKGNVIKTKTYYTTLNKTVLGEVKSIVQVNHNKRFGNNEFNKFINSIDPVQLEPITVSTSLHNDSGELYLSFDVTQCTTIKLNL